MEEATLKTHKMEFSLLQYNLCEEKPFTDSLQGICQGSPQEFPNLEKYQTYRIRRTQHIQGDVTSRQQPTLSDWGESSLGKVTGITLPTESNMQKHQKDMVQWYSDVSITGNIEIHYSITGKLLTM